MLLLYKEPLKWGEKRSSCVVGGCYDACELPLSVVLLSARATLNKKCDLGEGVASN